MGLGVSDCHSYKPNLEGVFLLYLPTYNLKVHRNDLQNSSLKRVQRGLKLYKKNLLEIEAEGFSYT